MFSGVRLFGPVVFNWPPISSYPENTDFQNFFFFFKSYNIIKYWVVRLSKKIDSFSLCLVQLFEWKQISIWQDEAIIQIVV